MAGEFSISEQKCDSSELQHTHPHPENARSVASCRKCEVDDDNVVAGAKR
jgi:hypothetical protein